jgi:hypothetical protein
MECPHCGARVDRPLGWLEHPVFDDRLQRIVAGNRLRRPTAMQWRMLTKFRERFGRFVPDEFLAEVCGRTYEPSTTPSIRCQLIYLRRALVGTPFTIANDWNRAYGLFWRTEVRVGSFRHPRANNGRQQFYRLNA